MADEEEEKEDVAGVEVLRVEEAEEGDDEAVVVVEMVAGSWG